MKPKTLRDEDAFFFDPNIFNDRRSQFINRFEKKFPQLVSLKLININMNWLFSTSFAIFGFAKFVETIIQDISRVSRVGNYSLANKEIAIIFDLTRQHLPPAIPTPDLEDFFFLSHSNLLKPGTNSVVILDKLSKESRQLSDRLFSYPSLNQLVFATKNDLPSRCLLLTKAFFLTISSVRICRNFLSSLGVLCDLFEMHLFLESNLNTNMSIAFVTNTSFYSSPAIFYLDKRTRSFDSEMLHYSENSLPLTFKEFEEKGIPNWIFNSRVDTHKVWTDEYASFLTSTNPLLSVEVVGSLIFRPIKTRQSYKRIRNQILLLDVNPSIHESKNGPYTDLAGRRFLDCIEDVKPFLANIYVPMPTFKIKSKRRRIAAHSDNYIEHKMELIARGILEEVPWQANLYSLIAESAVVLCSVGTSPALIARELGIPVAMFYSGENELMDALVDYGIPILQDSAALYSFLSSHLEES